MERLHVAVPLRSDDLVRRSDQHQTALRGMRSSDAAEYQGDAYQKRNTQDCDKAAYYYGLPDHYAVHIVLPVLLSLVVYLGEVLFPWMEWLMFHSIHSVNDVGPLFFSYQLLAWIGNCSGSFRKPAAVHDRAPHSACKLA